MRYLKNFFIIFFIGLIFIRINNGNCGWIDKGKDLLNNFSKNVIKSPNRLTTTEIAKGLKDALKVGTENVVKQLGKPDGFLKDKAIHIPLPDKLKKIKRTLKKIGMANSMNNLETKLNRAAEIATPKVKKLFWNAIADMTIDDVNKIYKGPEDAATQYFKKKMKRPLAEAMRPIIDDSLNQVAAIQMYNSILSKYNSLPFVKHINADITTYTIDKAIEGIFYYIAKEEAAIRKNPAKRTTELLKKVFGK